MNGGHMNKKIKLFLVRHGETYLNKYNKLQGWTDSPLTENGKRIVTKTGKRLKNVPFHYIYTSDLERTVETAKLILEQNRNNKNRNIHKNNNLREVFFGSFEGEYIDDFYKKVLQQSGCNNTTALYKNHSLEEVMNFIKKIDPFSHAENYPEFWKRIEIGLNEIVSQCCNNENILLVTHGVVIKTIINEFSKKGNIEQEIKNSSISILEYSNNTFSVVSING